MKRAAVLLGSMLASWPASAQYPGPQWPQGGQQGPATRNLDRGGAVGRGRPGWEEAQRRQLSAYENGCPDTPITVYPNDIPELQDAKARCLEQRRARSDAWLREVWGERVPLPTDPRQLEVATACVSAPFGPVGRLQDQHEAKLRGDPALRADTARKCQRAAQWQVVHEDARTCEPINEFMDPTVTTAERFIDVIRRSLDRNAKLQWGAPTNEPGTARYAIVSAAGHTDLLLARTLMDCITAFQAARRPGARITADPAAAPPPPPPQPIPRALSAVPEPGRFGVASWEPGRCRDLTAALRGANTAGEIGDRLGEVLKSAPFQVTLQPGSTGVLFVSTADPSHSIRVYEDLGLCEAAAPPATAASSSRSDPDALLKAWARENDRCRGGSGDEDATHAACDARDGLTSQLVAAGWCHGRRGEAGYQMQWHRCGRDSLR